MTTKFDDSLYQKLCDVLGEMNDPNSKHCLEVGPLTELGDMTLLGLVRDEVSDVMECMHESGCSARRPDFEEGLLKCMAALLSCLRPIPVKIEVVDAK